LPYNGEWKNISFCLKWNKSKEAIINNVSLWKNNITIGDIWICEHVLALQQGIWLKLDYLLTENNFPSFDNWLVTILEKIKPYIKKIWESNYFTVKNSIWFEFDNWWYFIIDPDEWEKKLVVDHQFSYKNKSLWTQRVLTEITPELFSFIAKARPISSWVRTQIAQALFGIWISSIPFMGFRKENALYVNDNEIINPNSEFVDNNWINREGIMHEVIDKLWAITLLWWRRFVWKITTYRTNHANDVEVMRYILENQLLEDN
jgi:hypothetical protein